jgi:hypothetical protein
MIPKYKGRCSKSTINLIWVYETSLLGGMGGAPLREAVATWQKCDKNQEYGKEYHSMCHLRSLQFRLFESEFMMRKMRWLMLEEKVDLGMFWVTSPPQAKRSVQTELARRGARSLDGVESIHHWRCRSDTGYSNKIQI